MSEARATQKRNHVFKTGDRKSTEAITKSIYDLAPKHSETSGDSKSVTQPVVLVPKRESIMNKQKRQASDLSIVNLDELKSLDAELKVAEEKITSGVQEPSTVSYEYATALHPFANPDSVYISFKAGAMICVLSRDPSGWWRGCVATGNVWGPDGAFPGSYVEMNS